MTTIPEIPDSALSVHHARAAALMLLIRKEIQAIEGFAFITPGHRRKLIPYETLSDAFFESGAVAAETAPDAATASQITAPEIRDTINYSLAYMPLANELEIHAKALRHSIAGRRAGVGQKVLRFFNFLKGISRPEEREILIPHLEAMKKARMRRRATTSAPEGPAVPPAVK